MLPMYRLRTPGRGARQWAPVGLSLSFAAAVAFTGSLDFSLADNSQYVPIVFL